MKESYALGDEYLRANKYLEAEACYAFPEIDDHINNMKESRDVNNQKLKDLKRMRHGIPPKATNINKQLLSFIKSFYKPWLEEIVKPTMIVCKH